MPALIGLRVGWSVPVAVPKSIREHERSARRGRGILYRCDRLRRAEERRAEAERVRREAEASRRKVEEARRREVEFRRQEQEARKAE